MPNAAEKAWALLDKFAKTLEPRVKAAFLEAIRQVRAEVPQEVLDYVVRSGDTRPLIDRLETHGFRLAVRDAITRAASTTALPSLPVKWDVLNPKVIEHLRATELQLVNQLKAGMREGLSQALVVGVKTGVNPRDTARDIRAMIGLTPKQVQSVANYRRLLAAGREGIPSREVLRRLTRDKRYDKTLLRAMTRKVPLSVDQITTQVARFQERLINRQAETVARTETIRALYEGQQSKWAQAIQEGKIDAGDLRRFWHVAKDERVCKICQKIPGLNPEGVAFHEPFQTPVGLLMGPTAHPNCRCVVFTKIMYGRGVAA